MNNRKLLLCKLIVTLSGEWEWVGSKTTTNQNLNLFRTITVKNVLSMKNNSKKRSFTVSNLNILSGSRELLKQLSAFLENVILRNFVSCPNDSFN